MRAEAILPDLIRRAGESPAAVLAGVEPALLALGFRARRTTAGPEAVLWTRGAAPRLALSGHVDVVPVGEGWQRDPHGGEVADGRVWGRGACDMLGAVAAFVGAAALVPDAPCAILLTTDEETRMGAAEAALREGLLAGLEAVVVGEPTDFAVGRAEKGVLWLRVRTSGRNAHGSMPELGDNAAERLVRALAAAQGMALPGEHALLGKPTLNLGTLRAGEAVNQVPASATAELDLRYLPGTTSDALMQALWTRFREAGESPSIEIVSHHPPFETRANAPLVKAAQGAVAAVRGDAQVLGLPYGTEASRYAPAGLDCVILGPGEPGLAHTNRESVRLDALRDAERIYADLLVAYAGRRA